FFMGMVSDFAYNLCGSKYMTQTNERQLQYIRAAEELTAPDDPVLDGVGMVLTRPAPGPHWLLHSSVRRAYERGRRDHFGEYMRTVAPPVLITNYRWDWLEPADRAVRKAQYLELDKNFFVLGGQVAVEDGVLPIARSGRYALWAKGESQDVLVDGVRQAPNSQAFFEAGLHLVSGQAKFLRFAWLGPTATAMPSFGKRAKGPLFPTFKQ
ncbi:MAG: hypothetical protein KC416_15415, partial [Myxococcales bacterium]|nr:hypothetical protein [Myxococcales bacterium]